jgi:hypothetical protein
MLMSLLKNEDDAGCLVSLLSSRLLHRFQLILLEKGEPLQAADDKIVDSFQTAAGSSRNQQDSDEILYRRLSTEQGKL